MQVGAGAGAGIYTCRESFKMREGGRRKEKQNMVRSWDMRVFWCFGVLESGDEPR